MSFVFERTQYEHARTAGLALLLVLLASSIVFLPLPITLFTIASLAALALAVRWPWLVWMAIGLLTPFAAAEHLGPGSALDLLLVAAIVLWAADGIRRRRWQITWHAPVIAAFVYAMALGISALRAQDLGQAATEVIKWAEFAAVIAVLPQMVSRAQTRWVIAALAAGASAQALLGIYEFVYRIGPEWFIVLGRFMRASGTFAQPNPFAGYLSVTLPVLVSIAIAAWGDLVSRRRAWGTWAWAIYLTGCSAVIGAGILASWSRGGWMAAVAGLLVVFFLRSRRTLILGGLAVVVLLAGALLTSLSWQSLPEPIAARVQAIPEYFGGGDVLHQEVNDDNFAVIERLAHWAAAERMFASEPLLGVGPGNYEAAYPVYRLPAWEDALGHAHNSYLNVLAESGILGFAAFALLWGVTLVWLIRLRRTAAALMDSYGAALVLGVLGLLAALAVHSIVDVLFVQGIYIQIALCLALCAALEVGSRMRQSRNEGAAPITASLTGEQAPVSAAL